MFIGLVIFFSPVLISLSKAINSPAKHYVFLWKVVMNMEYLRDNKSSLFDETLYIRIKTKMDEMWAQFDTDDLKQKAMESIRDVVQEIFYNNNNSNPPSSFGSYTIMGNGRG